MPASSTGFCVASTRNGVGQRVGHAVDGHVALGHRLEQRRLRLGRGPVDLVDQQDVGEHRARAGTRSFIVLVSMIDDPVMSPGSMSGVHCTRRLSAPHRLTEGAGEHRLADAGHVLEQDVAVGADGDQRQAHDVVLAVDDGVDVVDDLRRTLCWNCSTSMVGFSCYRLLRSG